MRIVYLFAMMLLLANPTFSATVNGNLTTGNKDAANLNSQGSFDISVTKNDAVQISNLNSIVITSDSGGTDKTASDDVCYYATTAQYTIDMDSVNSMAGNFKLTHNSDPAQKVPYELYWDDAKDGSNEAIFISNSDTAQTFASNNRTSASCQTTGGTNARVTVFIKNDSYNSMVTGLYTDIVHITLKAQ